MTIKRKTDYRPQRGMKTLLDVNGAISREIEAKGFLRGTVGLDNSASELALETTKGD